MRIPYSLISKIVNLLLIAGIVALFFIKGQIHSEETDHVKSDTEVTITPEVMQFFPKTTSLSRADTAWIEVKGEEGELLGYLLYTSPYADKIYGFAGKTPLLIALDPNWIVLGTALLENNETPGYVKRVTETGLFDSWTGLSAKEALNKEVDAISGATRTTDAVTESFRLRMNMLQHTQYHASKNTGKLIKNIFALLVVGFALYCFFTPQSGKKYRLLLLSLSVIILGFWQGIFLSLEGMYAWTVNGVSFKFQYVLLIIFILSVLLPVLFGKSFYCQWLCPYGALQELAGKVSKKKWKISSSLRIVLTGMRKYILLIIVFLLLLNVIADLSYFEPFSAFNVRSASVFTLILAGSFLLLSFFVNRPWCSFFCPTGQFLDIFKSLSIKRNKIHKNEK